MPAQVQENLENPGSRNEDIQVECTRWVEKLTKSYSEWIGEIISNRVCHTYATFIKKHKRKDYPLTEHNTSFRSSGVGIYPLPSSFPVYLIIVWSLIAVKTKWLRKCLQNNDDTFNSKARQDDLTFLPTKFVPSGGINVCWLNFSNHKQFQKCESIISLIFFFIQGVHREKFLSSVLFWYASPPCCSTMIYLTQSMPMNLRFIWPILMQVLSPICNLVFCYG